MKKERADLTRFDEELNELELVIKQKRQDVVDAELVVKEIEHHITTLQKERTAATHAVTALEKGNPWIEQDKECVSQRLKLPALIVFVKVIRKTWNYVRFWQARCQPRKGKGART